MVSVHSRFHISAIMGVKSSEGGINRRQHKLMFGDLKTLWVLSLSSSAGGSKAPAQWSLPFPPQHGNLVTCRRVGTGFRNCHARVVVLALS